MELPTARTSRLVGFHTAEVTGSIPVTPTSTNTLPDPTGTLAVSRLSASHCGGEAFGVFMHRRPEIVFHAAAHKHVPVLEVHPEEALATNVIGTANLADAAVASGTERFVLISTDKAINPASVMGASKWMAERRPFEEVVHRGHW
jgi:nucleoside-diphosphate-sugar epimerase